MKRHQTKPNKDDFNEIDMSAWWNEKDFINFIPENGITNDMELKDTVEYIYQDVMSS